MRIGVIGSGQIGATVAHLLAAAGHDMAIANSRGPESLAELVSELGDTTRAATVEDAARFGEIVVVAIPLHAVASLAAEAFAGRIVVDANNYYPGRDGQIAELDDNSTTSSELLAARLPGDARVVKAFNTMHFEALAGEGMPEAPLRQRYALFVAGDDDEAKQLVSALIEEVGFAAVDAGMLAEGSRLQPGTTLYNRRLSLPQARRELAALRP